jgi:hypothetical protein
VFTARYGLNTNFCSLNFLASGNEDVRGKVGRAARNVSLDGRTVSYTGLFTVAVRVPAVRSVCVTG